MREVSVMEEDAHGVEVASDGGMAEKYEEGVVVVH